MNADLCYYFLKLKMIIQNMLRWVIRKIYVTNSVTVVDNGKKKSVYWRYIAMYIILLFKFLLLDQVLKWCCDNIDVNSDTIQVVKNIDYVDRYIIYENKDGKNAIQNVIKYLDDNEKNIGQVTLPKNLVLRCELTMDNGNIDLKGIFAKYATEKIDNHTIGNIFLFNDISPTSNSKIMVSLVKEKKLIKNEFYVGDVLDEKISYVYN